VGIVVIMIVILTYSDGSLFRNYPNSRICIDE